MQKQRFKNFNLDSFLDSKIAEEQAKQLQGQASGLRRNPSGAKRPNSRTSSRTGEGDRFASQRGPDPSEFVIEDEDGPSRVSTPKPPELGATAKGEEGDGLKADKTERASEDKDNKPKDIQAGLKPSGNDGLPQDIQIKLRRLQKLESKYNGKP